MISWFGAAFVTFRLILPTSLALTATLAYAGAGLGYEWNHFLAHTRVPLRRGSYWRKMKEHHIKHHLLDSSNWFAFLCLKVDDWFGSNPEAKGIHEQARARSARLL